MGRLKAGKLLTGATLALLAATPAAALTRCDTFRLEQAAHWAEYNDTRQLEQRFEDDGGRTALHLAVIYDCPKKTALFLSRDINVSLQDYNGRSALHYAAAGTNAETLALLLQHGADPLLPDYHGRTALHYAAAGESPEIVALLLPTYHENPDASGKTALEYAAVNPRQSVGVAFFRKGLGKERYFELLAAATTENFKAMIEQLADDADLAEYRDPKGNTLLHLAAEKGSPAAAEILLAHGAQRDAHDRFGNTPLDTALIFAQPEVGDYLIAQGSTVDPETVASAWHIGLRHASKRALEWLLSLGADPHARDSVNGWRPIETAVRNGNVDAVALLLEHGVDIDARGTRPMEMCPIDTAIDAGQWEVLAYLVSKNAATERVLHKDHPRLQLLLGTTPGFSTSGFVDEHFLALSISGIILILLLYLRLQARMLALPLSAKERLQRIRPLYEAHPVMKGQPLYYTPERSLPEFLERHYPHLATDAAMSSIRYSDVITGRVGPFECFCAHIWNVGHTWTHLLDRREYTGELFALALPTAADGVIYAVNRPEGVDTAAFDTAQAQLISRRLSIRLEPMRLPNDPTFNDRFTLLATPGMPTATTLLSPELSKQLSALIETGECRVTLHLSGSAASLWIYRRVYPLLPGGTETETPPRAVDDTLSLLELMVKRLNAIMPAEAVSSR